MTEIDPNESPREPDEANAEEGAGEGSQPENVPHTPAEPPNDQHDSQTMPIEGTDGEKDEVADHALTVDNQPDVQSSPDEADLQTAPDEETSEVADRALSPDKQPDVHSTPDEADVQTAPDEEPPETADRTLSADDEPEPASEQAAEQPEPTPPRPPERSHAAVADDTSDVASIPDEPADDPKSPTSQHRAGDWQAEMSAHRIAVELKRIETRIRELLSDRDSRRKRKLAGTFRWHELEEDIIGWRAERRLDADTIEELHRLVIRRHFLFNQLRFAASTRPTWNS